MKIGIIGLGLIGGSLARQILKNTAHEVYAYDIDEDAMLKGALLNAYTGRLDIDATSWDVDILIIALSPERTVSVMKSVLPKLKDGAIVTDTAGVKREIVGEMEKLKESRPSVGFVGCHPMAGREYSGVAHSTASLFEKAYIILTPVTMGDLWAIDKLSEFFKEVGCEGINVTSKEEHDKMIAFTSQLAHVVSSAYMLNPVATEHTGFSAGSFRDLTRVAKLDSVLWTELFTDNADNLVGMLDDIIFRLTEYREAIATCDKEKLSAMLKEGTARKEEAERARRKK